MRHKIPEPRIFVRANLTLADYLKLRSRVFDLKISIQRAVEEAIQSWLESHPVPPPPEPSEEPRHGAFADAVREELKRREWQQKDLVERTGLPASTISGVLSGAKEGRAETRDKIAAVLGIENPPKPRRANRRKKD